MRHQKGAYEIHPEGSLERALIKILRLSDLADAGIIDKAIDPPELIDDALHEPVGIRRRFVSIQA